MRARRLIAWQAGNVTVIHGWYERGAGQPETDRARRRRATTGHSNAAERLNTEGLADVTLIERPADFVNQRHSRRRRRRPRRAGRSDRSPARSHADGCHGQADGCVAGATRPTADVIRAGLRILGVADGVGAVSSSFFFVLPGRGGRWCTATAACCRTPDIDQLASIAVSSARTFAQLSGADPAVAMLSFSTKGSAEHPRVDKVRAATAAAQALAPDLAIDGELQFDAALLPSVAEAKAPDSPRRWACEHLHLSRPRRGQHRLQNHRTLGRRTSVRTTPARTRRSAPRPLARLLNRRHRQRRGDCVVASVTPAQRLRCARSGPAHTGVIRSSQGHDDD